VEDLLQQVDEWVFDQCGEEQYHGDGEGSGGGGRGGGSGGSGGSGLTTENPFPLAGLDIPRVVLAFPAQRPTPAGGAAPPVPVAVPVSLERIGSFEALQRSFGPQFDELCGEHLLPAAHGARDWTPWGERVWTVRDCSENLMDQLVAFLKDTGRAVFGGGGGGGSGRGDSGSGVGGVGVPLPPRFISIGSDCGAPNMFRYLNVREESSPFDWTVSPLATAARVLAGELVNLTSDLRVMDRSGGSSSEETATFLGRPFSVASGMLFSHDGVCAARPQQQQQQQQQQQHAAGEARVGSSEGSSAGGLPGKQTSGAPRSGRAGEHLAPCTPAAGNAFHEKYVALQNMSVNKKEDGIPMFTCVYADKVTPTSSQYGHVFTTRLHATADLHVRMRLRLNTTSTGLYILT